MMTINERTQQILAERIGMLLIGAAKLQAELEAVAAAAERRGSPNGAQGADGSGTQDGPHG